MSRFLTGRLVPRGGARAGLGLGGALLALLPAVAAAQTLVSGSDSGPTRAHVLADVLVRALRPERFAVGSRQLELDSVVLAQYRGGTVADALQARTPLYLKSYGPGQLASISLRGTAARHTAVLWQGFTINLPSLGEADFALLPLGANSRVAVQLGPAAALYGSGAIGGVVLLNSEPDWRPGLHGSGQADAGSFGLRGGSLDARAASARVAVHVAAGYRQATNDYPYLYQEPRALVRRTLDNAALRHQWSLNQDVALRLGAAGELTAAAWLTDTDRQIQTAVSAAPAQTSERDQSRRLLLGYRRVASPSRQWAVRGAWFEDVLDYRDNGATDRSRVRTTQLQAEHTAALGRHATLRLGGEVQHFAARVDGYGPAEITESRAAAFALLRADPAPGLRLSANLRQALLPGGAAPLTPTAGLEWDVLRPGRADSLTNSPAHQLTAKVSVSRSYRAPTLNERYWRPGGRPDLRPETGQGFEGGARHRWQPAARTALTTELTAFEQLVDDWVQWLPDAAGIWSPRNLRQVRSRGLEASTALRWRPAAGRYELTAQAAYSLTATVKTQGSATDATPVGQQLAFVPRHQATISADQRWRGWLLSTSGTLTGRRYTDSAGSEFLPGYVVLGAALGHTWPVGQLALTGLLQVSNLLDHAYYSYPGRPAPPRAGQLSLRVDWR